MRWAPSVLSWALLLGFSAHGQALLRYPGDRAVARAASSGGGSLSAKRIATLGDSNTEGYGLAENERWTGRLVESSRLGATYTLDNYGVGGHTCLDVDARWTSLVASRAYGVVVLMCGTNDHRTYGTDAATIYARISALIAKVKATGARVVLMTVLPAGASYDPTYTAGMEATRDALNALIRGTQGVTVVDLDPLLQGAGEPPALAQSLDGLHLNPAGAVIVANALHPLLVVP
jgi:lysophospholipase L1-like esterase